MESTRRAHTEITSYLCNDYIQFEACDVKLRSILSYHLIKQQLLILKNRQSVY